MQAWLAADRRVARSVRRLGDAAERRDFPAVTAAASRAQLAGSESLAESFPHPIFGPLNLKEWIAFHRIHAFDHIQQIERLKADPAYPAG